MSNRLALLLALASTLGCGGINIVRKQGLELPPIEFPLRTFAYPSGLRVIVEKDVRTPLAGVFTVVGSGSSSDPVGKEGLAHYLEHLAFRTRPFGGDTFWDELVHAGVITHNASTSFDATSYYEIGVASALPQMLKLEAARMLAPVAGIPEPERAIELDVVHNELRQRNETGFIGDVLAQLQSALFPTGHPYARSIGGSHESLAAIRWEDIEAFARAHYRPDNMTMVIVGNVDLATVDKILAASLPLRLVAAPVTVRPPPRLPPTPPALPNPPGPADAVPRVEASIASPELWLAWSLPRGFDRDGYLLSFVASAVQRTLGRVRRDDSDVLGVQVSPVQGTEASLVLCRVELNKADHVEKTVKAMLAEVSHVTADFLLDASAGLSSDTRYSAQDVLFSRVRRNVLVTELLQAQDLGTRGMRRATVTHFSQDPALFSKAIGDLAAFKPDRLRDYAGPHLTAERARAVLFVPRSGQAAAAGPGAAAAVKRSGDAGKPPKEWMDALLAGARQIQAYKLPNGLQVVLERRAGLPLLAASVQIATGADAGAEGAAATFARMMGGPQRLYNDPSEYGGNLGRSQGGDHVTYAIEGTSGNAEILVATLAEYVRTVQVDHGDNVSFNEFQLPRLERREREPGWIAQTRFFETLLPGHPFGHTPAASELKDVSTAAATAWIARTHAPRSATLAVVGAFELADMQKWVADSFGGWKDPVVPPPAQPAPATATGAATAVNFLATPRPGASQGELHFGCLLPEATTGAMAARHDLAARLLQDRLFRTLRETSGATYGAHTRAVTLQGGTAYLELTGDIENAKLKGALAEGHKSLADLAEHAVGDERLAWAKLEAAATLALRQVTDDGAAALVLGRARLGHTLDPADQHREIESVTAEEIKADFQHCLKANPTLSLVGEESVIKPAFEAGWRAGP